MYVHLLSLKYNVSNINKVQTNLVHVLVVLSFYCIVKIVKLLKRVIKIPQKEKMHNKTLMLRNNFYSERAYRAKMSNWIIL